MKKASEELKNAERQLGTSDEDLKTAQILHNAQDGLSAASLEVSDARSQVYSSLSKEKNYMRNSMLSASVSNDSITKNHLTNEKEVLSKYGLEIIDIIPVVGTSKVYLKTLSDLGNLIMVSLSSDEKHNTSKHHLTEVRGPFLDKFVSEAYNPSAYDGSYKTSGIFFEMGDEVVVYFDENGILKKCYYTTNNSVRMDESVIIPIMKYDLLTQPNEKDSKQAVTDANNFSFLLFWKHIQTVIRKLDKTTIALNDVANRLFDLKTEINLCYDNDWTNSVNELTKNPNDTKLKENKITIQNKCYDLSNKLRKFSELRASLKIHLHKFA